MKEWKGFTKGIDLGGWLSQCKTYSKEHMDTFILESDIERIASWGLDHVRLPFDFNIFERPEGGFVYLERAVAWCEKHRLNVVLDLHKTKGFSFDAGEKEDGFFDSAELQEYFYTLWENVAKKFANRADVAFELLNEVTEPSYIDAWNRIAGECIRRIRVIAPETVILVGSYHNNHATALGELNIPMDDRIVYNFHCYDPLPFTHQGAYWTKFTDLRMAYDESGCDQGMFEYLFAPALSKAKKDNTILYCGEYGVIDIVSPEEALKWFRDIHAVFEKYGIGRAVWSYKKMDFGLTDARLDGVREELLKLL